MLGYKYRGLNYFERDLSTLIENQIFAPLYKDLNDPYEALYNEEFKFLLELIENRTSVDTKEIIKSFEEIVNYQNVMGIYSLSKSYKEELLWVHYASSHKGICFEYDTLKLKDKYLANSSVHEVFVDYKSRPQTISINDLGNKVKIFKKLFATKSENWAYEKEYRLIFDSSSLKEYHPAALTGIYFGALFDEDKIQDVIIKLEGRNINFYKIYQEKGSYNLKRKLIHENKRKINKIIDPEIFEILSIDNQPAVENINILYKGNNVNQYTINYFFEAYRENFAYKPCNIFLYDSKSIKNLIFKCSTLTNEEYLKFADHYIAESYFDTPNSFIWYPFQDLKYKEIGGENYKKDKFN